MFFQTSKEKQGKWFNSASKTIGIGRIMMLERFSEPPAQSCLPLPRLHGGVRMVAVVGMCGKIACTTADAPMTPGEEFDDGSEDEGDGVATLALYRPLSLMTMGCFTGQDSLHSLDILVQELN